LKTFSIDVNPVVKKEKIEFNKVLLAFSDDNLEIELKEKKEIIQNAIFEIFENTNADDFNHVKSMIDLSEKIKEEVNDNLSSGKISEVYFKH
jgi:flagellar basal body-associated protein FliL